MSDRFALHASKEEIEELFDVHSERDDYFEPDYNIDPGTRVPVVIKEGESRAIKYAQWGMIPADAENEAAGKQNYEMKAEELEEDDRMREAFERRRCIIPANGFYKWKTGKKKSTPFYIRLLSNELMGFGGLYSIWQSESGRDVYSFSLLTTEANALVQPIDDRMPVILRKESFDIWLDQQKVDVHTFEGLLRPYLLTEMAVNRVSEDVNDPGNNDPSLIQPIPK